MTPEQLWYLSTGVFVIASFCVGFILRRADYRFMLAHPKASRILVLMLVAGLAALFFSAPPAYRTVFRYLGLFVIVILVPLAYLAKLKHTNPGPGLS